MTAAGQNGSEENGRLYACLTKLIDAGARTLSPNEVTALIDDPDVAEEVQAYLEAAEEIHQFASAFAQIDVLRRSFPMPLHVGDYELLAEIGRGGAAVVYQARQAGLNRLVAIKMLHGGRPGSLQDVERIRFEAEAVAQLQHPGSSRSMTSVSTKGGRGSACRYLKTAASHPGYRTSLPSHIAPPKSSKPLPRRFSMRMSAGSSTAT